METHGETVETRKKSSRRSVTIHFTPGQDDDLIRLMFAIPRGQRANAAKGLLRGVMSGNAATIPHQKPLPLAPNVTGALDELVNGMRWVQDALNDLPGYLDRMIAARPVVMDAPPLSERETASQDVLLERAARMKKAKW